MAKAVKKTLREKCLEEANKIDELRYCLDQDRPHEELGFYRGRRKTEKDVLEGEWSITGILEEAAYLIELIQQDAPDLTAEDKSQVRQLKKFIKKWQDKKS